MKRKYTITNDILTLTVEISRLLGKYEGLTLPTPKPELRKHTKILTIQSSLAIEGNTLTVDQVTDIINNKRVVGPKKDILEVKNAIKVYDLLYEYEPNNLKSLLKAHKILMGGLIKEAGQFRKKNVTVGNQFKIVYTAPEHALVPKLMDSLFLFMESERDLNPLIKSSIFHYEFEFIHPFIDGNGRIGRLWQSVILYKYLEVFEYIPIEKIIKRRQMEYYEALQVSKKKGESSEFIRFMLEVIKEATERFTKEVKPSHQSTEIRLNMARDQFGENTFSRKDYLNVHKNISAPTASRDLIFAADNKVLKKIGDKNTTKYYF